VSIAQFMTFLIMPVGCLLIALLFSWMIDASDLASVSVPQSAMILDANSSAHISR
jgi:hypothetical protein